jgi:hypothetical protein
VETAISQQFPFKWLHLQKDPLPKGCITKSPIIEGPNQIMTTSFPFLFSKLFPGFSVPIDGPTKLTVFDKLATNLESRAIVPGRLFRILIISV